MWEHNHARLKDGAQLFEADTFKSNIAQWAWDFHTQYMSREGATEGGFGELIAKMPKNMSGLIAFLVHNQARIKRDEATLDLPVGLAAGDNSYLAQNPSAGLDALKTSITQFAAAMTSPPIRRRSERACKSYAGHPIDLGGLFGFRDEAS